MSAEAAAGVESSETAGVESPESPVEARAVEAAAGRARFDARDIPHPGWSASRAPAPTVKYVVSAVESRK